MLFELRSSERKSSLTQFFVQLQVVWPCSATSRCGDPGQQQSDLRWEVFDLVSDKVNDDSIEGGEEVAEEAATDIPEQRTQELEVNLSSWTPLGWH